jgi:hypothetical protein
MTARVLSHRTTQSFRTMVRDPVKDVHLPLLSW